MDFGGDDNRFRFAGVEFCPQGFDRVLVIGRDHAHPGRQLLPDGWRYYDFDVELAKQRKLADGAEIEYGGRVGDNDQAPVSLSALWRSRSNSSMP